MHHKDTKQVLTGLYSVDYDGRNEYETAYKKSRYNLAYESLMKKLHTLLCLSIVSSGIRWEGKEESSKKADNEEVDRDSK